MAKYLCKIDLYNDDGELCFIRGNKYTKIETDHSLGDAQFMNEVGHKHDVSTGGWSHAFELVEVEWPEMMTTGGVIVEVRRGKVYLEMAYKVSTAFNVASTAFGVVEATALYNWFGRYIEAAESEST